ncbi:hypothetical protein [Mangrovimonas sp. ST2L15]|uniref:hypothetical protein n=1 Tax=Mangrovimonas sp. ST2L15 TaxID=1645916 RepID=UPI000A6046B6|nr:hypothetical protein [Mangrovimonas sp. ST2L15]
MKKITLMLTAMSLSLVLGCSNESLGDENIGASQKKPKKVETTPFDEPENDGEHCFITHLIAGQTHVAGSVTIDVDGDQLIITYTTNEDWTIGTTHLSIGICESDWVPLNGAGNPQIGQFEFTEPTSQTSTEVVYIIPISEVGDNYCFAAHAEVQGPTGGETAWALGDQFDGNSWAMYDEFNLSDCESDDDGGDDDGGGDGGDNGGQIPT